MLISNSMFASCRNHFVKNKEGVSVYHFFGRSGSGPGPDNAAAQRAAAADVPGPDPDLGPDPEPGPCSGTLILPYYWDPKMVTKWIFTRPRDESTT